MTVFQSEEAFFRANFRAIEAFRKGFEKAAFTTAREGRTIVRKKTVEVDALYKRIFLKGWKASKTKNGASYYTDVPHAVHVEYGVPAGTHVALLDLIPWVRTRIFKNMEPNQAIVYRTALAVQKKIKDVGTTPRPVWEETNKEVLPKMEKRAERLNKRMIRLKD